MRSSTKAPVLLSLRIFIINLVVLMLGFATAATIPYLYKSKVIEDRLAKVELPRAEQYHITLDLFYAVNSEAALLTVGWSLICVGSLSIWMILSLLVPLQVLEDTAKQFSRGDSGVRVPPLKMPELHQLGLLFNSVLSRSQTIERERQSLIDEFAHEMSTPITTLLGSLELLADGSLPVTAEILKQMSAEAERLKRLINDLRSLSQTNLNCIPVHLQVVDSYRLITDTIALLRVQHREDRLVLDLPKSLPQVFVDPDRMKQILLNLLGNALQYTPEGRVIVQAYTRADCLWIEIVDTGIGIAAEHLPYVFDRSWRSETSRQLRSEGSGIGLAVTKCLLEIQGGRIEVESELGQGSTFRFCLPLATYGN